MVLSQQVRNQLGLGHIKTSAQLRAHVFTLASVPGKLDELADRIAGVRLVVYGEEAADLEGIVDALVGTLQAIATGQAEEDARLGPGAVDVAREGAKLFLRRRES